MKSPTSQQQLLERLAILEHHIEELERRLAALRWDPARPLPAEGRRTFELLLASRETFREYARVLGAFLAEHSPPHATRAHPPSRAAPRHPGADADVVDVRDAASVKRWCNEFGCNEADLIQATYRAGDSPAAVSAYLERAVNRARGLGTGDPASDGRWPAPTDR